MTTTPSPLSSGPQQSGTAPAPAGSRTPTESPSSSGTPSPSSSGTPSPGTSGTPSPEPSGTPSPEQAALSDALAASYAAIYAYGLVGAQSAPDRREAARAALSAHRLGRDWLRATAATLGLTPPLPAAAYDTGRVTTPEAASELAARVELALVPRWSAVAGIVPEPGQRVHCAAEATACATRALAWGATPAAFPGTGSG